MTWSDKYRLSSENSNTTGNLEQSQPIGGFFKLLTGEEQSV